MTSVLNYSENDFPSLESSVKSKSKKRSNKFSSTAAVDSNASTTTNQFINNDESDSKDVGKNSSQENGDCSKCHQVRRKLGQSRKPEPTYSFNLKDFLAKPEKHPKNRVRIIKNFKDNHTFGGNPLDTDCPVRQKGFMNVSKQPKSLSKIKRAVHEGREEMKKIKNYSTEISIQKNDVLVRSEIPEEYLRKSIAYCKAGRLKHFINASPNDSKVDKKSINDEVDQKTLNDIKNSIESDGSHSPFPSDEESSRLSLQGLLQSSESPPFKILIHHHNFKSYCDNCITGELNRSASSLISQIVRYQYNKYQVNPTKAVANKRYVVGFRQVTKYVRMNKIKLFIIVPDMEDSLSNTVEELKSLASAYCIPYFFALSRRKLGFLTYKKVGVCCFGILDYSGAEANFKGTIESMTKAIKYYEEKSVKAKLFYESYFKHATDSNHSTSHHLDEMIQKFNENLALGEEMKEID